MTAQGATTPRVGTIGQATVDVQDRSIVFEAGLEGPAIPKKLVIKVDYERSLPLDLRVEPPLELLRVDRGLFEAPLSPFDQEAYRVVYTTPYEGVRIQAFKENGKVSTNRFSILDGYDKLTAVLPQAALQAQSMQAQSPVQTKSACASIRDTAKRFWLDFDLCTQFKEIRGIEAAVEERCHVPKELYEGVDHRLADQLKGFLEGRAVMRAALHKSRLDTGKFLPLPFGQQVLIRTTTEILITLVRRHFPRPAACSKHWASFDLDAFWYSSLAFASGRLRNEQNADWLNIEPNTFLISCFAELVDIAKDEPRIDRKFRQDCFALRVVFASILEPYFHVYRCFRSARPMQRGLYRRQNLVHALKAGRDPRWTDNELDMLRQAYWSFARDGSVDERRLLERWGESIVFALRDDIHICNI